MILNLLLEWARRKQLRGRLLQRRAQLKKDRTPVIVVPGMLGTRLLDPRGRVLWGTLLRLYAGPPITEERGVRVNGLLRALQLVPGLYAYDVYGGMIRFLEKSGGYRLGEDLFVLDYDWRLGTIPAAETLAELITRIRGFGDEKVDLVALSTGGLIAGAYLANAAANTDKEIRRVVYVGAPQRGSFDALACLYRGFRFAPGGRLFTPKETACCQTAFDALPHPDEQIFVDRNGRALDFDLYDPALWRKLSLAEHAPAEKLAKAAELHRLLDRRPPHADSFVIGAAHLPTPYRALIDRDRVTFPPPVPSARDPHIGYTYAPGDGELPATSLRALNGLEESRTWLVTPKAHHQLPSNPAVHRLILEALLATDRRIPETSLARSTALRVLNV